MGHLNVDEAHNSRLEPILWSFDHNNKFLLHLWTNFDGDGFLELLGYWIFNEPAIELYL